MLFAQINTLCNVKCDSGRSISIICFHVKDPTLTSEEYVLKLDSVVWLCKNFQTLANTNTEGRSRGQGQFS